MKKEIYICDVCGAERKEANHWFAGEITAHCVCIAPWGAQSFVTGGLFRDAKEAKHICGQECAHKFVDEYMSKAARVEVNCER